MAALPESPAHLVIQFRGKRPLAHPGGIGLGDAQNIVQIARTRTAAAGGLGRDGVGGSNKGIGAMVHVQHGALRPFKQNAATIMFGRIQYPPAGLDVRRDAGSNFLDPCNQVVPVNFRHPKPPTQRIVMAEQHIHTIFNSRIGKQVTGPERPARHLVFIGRPDAATGGADFWPALGADISGILTHPVQFTMQRQNKRTVFGNNQIVGAHVDPLFLQAVNFADQCPRVHHHPIADDGQLTATHNAGRQQAEFVDRAINHQRMTRVMTALKTHHHIGPFGQPVHNLAFALIAPLGANHNNIRHVSDLSLHHFEFT